MIAIPTPFRPSLSLPLSLPASRVLHSHWRVCTPQMRKWCHFSIVAALKFYHFSYNLSENDFASNGHLISTNGPTMKLSHVNVVSGKYKNRKKSRPVGIWFQFATLKVTIRRLLFVQCTESSDSFAACVCVFFLLNRSIISQLHGCKSNAVRDEKEEEEKRNVRAPDSPHKLDCAFDELIIH